VERGFGFVAPDSGGEDLFCHAANLLDGNALRPGARVHFKAAYDHQKQKPTAEEVSGGYFDPKRPAGGASSGTAVPGPEGFAPPPAYQQAQQPANAMAPPQAYQQYQQQAAALTPQQVYQQYQQPAAAMTPQQAYQQYLQPATSVMGQQQQADQQYAQYQQQQPATTMAGLPGMAQMNAYAQPGMQQQAALGGQGMPGMYGTQGGQEGMQGPLQNLQQGGQQQGLYGMAPLRH